MARTMTGRVVSNKADKTIVVAVQTRKTHPVYKKQYIQTTKFAAHDQNNLANEGDLVEIVECRPISLTKKFTLSKILEKAGVVHKTEADIEKVEEVTAKKSNEEIE